MKTTRPFMLLIPLIIAAALASGLLAGLPGFALAGSPVTAQPGADPADWGTLITDTTPYPVYQQVFTYTAPFRITDVRDDGDPPYYYSNKENYDMHRVGIFRPAAGGQLLEHRPVVFFVHGGAWVDGYRDWYDFVGATFAGQKGWVTVVVDYRLTSSEVFIADQYCPDRATCNLPQNQLLRTKAAEHPDNIQDVADAFAWTVDNIAAHGGDPGQIVAFGHSAGGHLVSLLATGSDTAALRPYLRGVVSMSGMYDLTDPQSQTAFLPYINQNFGIPHTQQELEQASPAAYILPGMEMPNLYLLYCESDLPTLPAQAQTMSATLTSAGIPFKFTYLQGYTHSSEMSAFNDPASRPVQAVFRFIEDTLGLGVFLPALER